jgi:hypothetical protein
LKQLTANLIDVIFPTRLVTATASPGIELVTNWQRERLVINLINYNSTLPARYGLNEDRLVKANGVVVRVNESRLGGPPESVVMQPGNRKLAWIKSNGWIEIRVPEFGVHTFVIVDRRKAE